MIHTTLDISPVNHFCDYVIILFLFMSTFPKKKDLRMSNYNYNKAYGFNDASHSYKKSTQHEKKSRGEDDDILIVGTCTAINRNCS